MIALRGLKAAADSLTPRRISLAPEDMRGLRFDLFSSIALGPTMGFEDSGFSLSPLLETDRSSSVVEGRSVSSEKKCG